MATGIGGKEVQTMGVKPAAQVSSPQVVEAIASHVRRIAKDPRKIRAQLESCKDLARMRGMALHARVLDAHKAPSCDELIAAGWIAGPKRDANLPVVVQIAALRLNSGGVDEAFGDQDEQESGVSPNELLRLALYIKPSKGMHRLEGEEGRWALDGLKVSDNFHARELVDKFLNAIRAHSALHKEDREMEREHAAEADGEESLPAGWTRDSEGRLIDEDGEIHDALPEDLRAPARGEWAAPAEADADDGAPMAYPPDEAFEADAAELAALAAGAPSAEQIAAAEAQHLADPVPAPAPEPAPAPVPEGNSDAPARSENAEVADPLDELSALL